MLHIKIPKPCHQNWDEMAPTSKGAFCSACAKEVVDFTAMTDAEVQMYFLEKATEKVCGKFNNRQLDRIRIHISPNVFYSRIAGWKKFMAVVLLAFGSMLFGCDVTQGDVEIDKTKIEQAPISVSVGDSIAVAPRETINGTPGRIENIVQPYEWTEMTKGGIEVQPVAPIEMQLMGEPAFVQPDSIEVGLVKDSIDNAKTKLLKDTSNCGEQKFY